MQSNWPDEHACTAHWSRLFRRSAQVVAAMICLGLATNSVLAQEAVTANPGAQATQNATTSAGQPAPQPNADSPQAADGAIAAPSAPLPVAPAGSSSLAQPGPTGAAVPASTLPHDLSPWGMFIAADWVVKGVMIGLAFASLITWTVCLAKSLEVAASKARLGKALRSILGARRLEEASTALGDRAGIGGVLVRAAVEEMEMSGHGLGFGDPSGIKERVESRLMRIQAQAGRRLSRGTGVLATIGSTAPFVGLFGTVWGIMNSFIGISESQTTNLAVVAPGIAEALLATAVGLIAAIPAVVVYNVFARSITGYRQGLADAAAGVQRLVSRDLDRKPLRDLGEPLNQVAVAAATNGRHAPAVTV